MVVTVKVNVARAPDEATRAELSAAARAGTLTRDDACRSVQRRGGGRRIVCRLADVTVTISAERPLALSELEGVAAALRKEVRAASAKGFDLRTFERVLADQHRARTTAPQLEPENASHAEPST